MDEADNAQLTIETVIDIQLANAMRLASLIPIGEPGECIQCGEYYSRTVNSLCGKCRDLNEKHYR